MQHMITRVFGTRKYRISHVVEVVSKKVQIDRPHLHLYKLNSRISYFRAFEYRFYDENERSSCEIQVATFTASQQATVMTPKTVTCTLTLLHLSAFQKAQKWFFGNLSDVIID